MKKKIIGILVCTLLIGATGIAVADWEENDGHKMHFPQLPNPNGWDVNFVDLYVGDDWRCSDTGFVTDIHFWYSWQQDITTDIPWIWVSIWSNNPGPPSTPKSQLWYRQFSSDEFIIAGPAYGDQGWYTPPFLWEEHDHDLYWQINIKDIDDPFEQQEGVIYWLVIKMPVFTDAAIGWKTSKNHWNDNAVYGVPGEWLTLWDPINPNDPIDFAFVITGEVPLPEIACEGALDWLRVRPEEYVTETFGVGNNGDTGSLLNWHVDSWPSWGTDWTFSPSSGSGLAAGDWVTVTVSCKAPSQPNQPFSGQIEVCNSDDPTQCCTIPVTLTTPRNRAINNPFLQFLQNHPNLFPILQQLLQRSGIQ